MIADEAPPRPGRSLGRRAALAALAIVVMTGAAVSAAGLLQLDDLQREFAKASGGRSLTLPDITPSEAGKPQTIMILGTDGRLGADKGGGQRSDTTILARLNASESAITLMSIPRDLKVTIPGYQLPDKINSAFTNGGTSLTLKTVKGLLSQPGKPFKINHVIQVDFTGFRRMVDYLGCTFVDADRRYFNDVGGPGGYATIDIDPGYQKICGSDALDYVRYRHGDNDLIRAARQQDFIRQLLRQPGVRQRIGFSRRTTLAQIAGRYTTTDDQLIRSKTALLSLARLGLGVADKPVQQVTFGAGRIQDDGDYLTASAAAIAETVDQFLNPRTVTTDTAKKASSSPKPKKKRRSSSSAGIPSGLTDFSALGETQAISAARKLRFPFYYPKLGVSTGRYADPQPRIYRIRANNRLYQAYRMVVVMGTTAPEYYGVQGMTWKNPPLLDGPHDTVDVDGRKLLVYYDGRKVRLVAWRTRRGVYYIHNTLARTESKSRLVAIARSLTHLGH
ncbi:MAG: LCP family protein [Solirubrobacteraceae bacterium]